MSNKHLRSQDYEYTEWEDRVLDENGDVLVEGTPINEVNLNNMETGILTSHLDVGMLATMAMQMANHNQQEIEKYKEQRILQGRETISNTESDNGYFRSEEPFVTISLPGFAQINAPDYDVQISATSADDMGRVGNLEVYDKTQNGFKVRMTGSANSVSFMWTLMNPNV